MLQAPFRFVQGNSHGIGLTQSLKQNQSSASAMSRPKHRFGTSTEGFLSSDAYTTEFSDDTATLVPRLINDDTVSVEDNVEDEGNVKPAGPEMI